MPDYDWLFRRRAQSESRPRDSELERLAAELARVMRAASPEMDSVQIEGLISTLSIEEMKSYLDLKRQVGSSTLHVTVDENRYWGYGDELLDDAGNDGLKAAWLNLEVEAGEQSQLVALEYLGTLVKLPNLAGTKYIMTLLQNPGQGLNSLDLDRIAGGEARPGEEWVTVDLPSGDDVALDDQGDIGITVGALPPDLPMADTDAIAGVKAGLSVARRQLQAARKRGDDREIHRLEAEIAGIERWLKESVDVRGKARPSGPGERARNTIKNAIARTVGAVAKQNPGLAEHIKDHVGYENGLWAYRPRAIRIEVRRRK